jgi:hypothetical protein
MCTTTLLRRRDLSWNDIIALLGPHLFQPLNEESANRELATSIASLLGLSGQSHRIDGEIFNTMKLQLLALGYIDINSLTTTKNTLAVFWTLTPLGKEVMLQMRTVKAPPGAS